MRYLPAIFESNRRWANRIRDERPEFFSQLATTQTPEYLWIGCSDSRVAANEICGLQPGQMFKHRNIANLVMDNDANCLSVIQYAVKTLKVRHIIVCGHYRCGGVHASMAARLDDPLHSWLQPIRHLRERHVDELEQLPDDEQRWNRLCELNVIEQVRQVASLPVVHEDWAQGRELFVHGWMYDLRTGLLHDMKTSICGPLDLDGPDR
jgi:carbonic anhydrase